MNKFIAFIIGSLGLAAAFLGLDRKRVKAERDQANQRADIAETRADYHEQQDAALAVLAEKQREEKINAEKSLDAGDRRQLDSDW